MKLTIMQDVKIYCNKKYNDKITLEDKKLITFFTPTYNRSKYLERIENCLLNQTCDDFVWVIVNDGSSDNTEEFVINILNKETLPVLLISKRNGGKHSAFKIALENCRTTYFQCMDDDDIYYPDAVQFYLDKWSEINLSENNNIGAIRTLSKYPDGKYVVNFEIKEEEYDASTIETYYKM